MIDTPEIEKVARALAPSSWAALGLADTLAHKNRRTASLRRARAALEALREPSAAMAWAANDAFPEAPAETTCRQIGETIWRAMMATALGDDKRPAFQSVPSLSPTPARGASSPESSLPESNNQSETP